jgi:hypothetical protein
MAEMRSITGALLITTRWILSCRKFPYTTRGSILLMKISLGDLPANGDGDILQNIDIKCGHKWKQLKPCNN